MVDETEKLYSMNKNQIICWHYVIDIHEQDACWYSIELINEDDGHIYVDKGDDNYGIY